MGQRGGTLSAFINETLADDLSRRKLAAVVEAYEEEHGPITSEPTVPSRRDSRRPSHPAAG